MRCRLSGGPGFTLIELLVVIAVIAVLAAILFPVFAQAREQARVSVCQSSLKQIGSALTMYAQDFDETYPQVTEWHARLTTWGPNWTVQLLPYEKADYATLEFGCPSHATYPRFGPPDSHPEYYDRVTFAVEKRGPRYAYNHMLGIHTEHKGFTPNNAITRVAQVARPAETIAVTDGACVTYAKCYGVYWAPFWADFFYFDFGPKQGWKGWLGHRNGKNILWVDGHVKFMPIQALWRGGGGNEQYYWLTEK
jgi:prepilin-type N-terminal cleavage/methylation domain-containing protein/prepilin-type processing-associated H-X9-DG protein